MSLATLPPELYLAILSHVPSSHLQISTLNLSRAIPFSPVPIRPLFEHISVSRQQQLPQLYRRLRYSPSKLANLGKSGSSDDECTWVKRFSVLIWQLDADILLNVLALLPVLEHLNLRIGPVFTPEHLQGMFKEPISSLNVLNLRFRPYVKTATYYQFLKGSYFDTVFDLISGWPSSCSLTRLSIIQDPLPPPSAGRTAFAQPIVFFSLTPLTALSLSPATQKVTHVRLRIPSRQPVRFITSPKPEDVHKYPFPNATVLDLSTCAIRNFSDLESLLNFVGGGRLRHLLLDHTHLCDGVARNWEMLGRTCALAGVKRSRDYEKTLKTSRQAITADTDNLGDTEERLDDIGQDRRPRPGRRGMAAATISLRERPTLPAASTPLPSTPHPSSAGKATKIRICPSPPRLLSLCIGLPFPPAQHMAEEIRIREASARTDFIRGWSEGVEQLRSIWTRLRQSQSKGVKVCRFHVENEGSEDMPMHTGLVEMKGSQNDKLWEELDTLEPPVLCFAGSRGEGFLDGHLEDDWSGHPNGCGHQISCNVWNDDL